MRTIFATVFILIALFIVPSSGFAEKEESTGLTEMVGMLFGEIKGCPTAWSRITDNVWICKEFSGGTPTGVVLEKGRAVAAFYAYPTASRAEARRLYRLSAKRLDATGECKEIGSEDSDLYVRRCADKFIVHAIERELMTMYLFNSADDILNLQR